MYICVYIRQTYTHADLSTSHPSWSLNKNKVDTNCFTHSLHSSLNVLIMLDDGVFQFVSWRWKS